MHSQIQTFGIKQLRSRDPAAQRDNAGQFTVLQKFADGGGLKFTARTASRLSCILFSFSVLLLSL
ncbi:hypothetical protein D9D10_12015 [Raoultella ornithinolytica]|nr:hypothetical protein D9D10_12015 [Raoultella ornithinolytica]